MSDLINRSELLKAMDTWDKFGYDEHNRLIRIDSTNEEYVPYVRYEDMVNCVMNMPTAYDIDKVVEELEERTDFLKNCTKYGNKDAEQQNKSYSTMMMYEVSDLVDDLIEIVKHGGVRKDMDE